MIWRQYAWLAAAAACSYWAGTPPAEPATDEAAAILDRYVEAIGGKAAHARIDNRVAKIKLEIARQAPLALRYFATHSAT